MMKNLLHRTHQEDQKVASQSLMDFSQQLSIGGIDVRQDVMHLQIQESGELLTVPKRAFDLFIGILNTMAQGKSVTVVPSDSELTTQQAADMLNVSRPFIVQLMERGKLPFSKVGTHRRVKLADLVKYRTKMDAQRNKSLSALSAQAQDLGFGYE